MNVMQLLFATHNVNKLSEIRKIIPPGYSLLTLSDINFNEELPETTQTFKGNALQKARCVFEKTGRACFADDSGLMVEALNGNPGVDSAFYGGLPRSDQKNNERLLKELAGTNNRSASFITIIAMIIDNREYFFEGILKGKIATGQSGKNGFGYDPLFIPDGLNKTLAELAPDEKNKLSHRAIAVQKLVTFLQHRNS